MADTMFSSPILRLNPPPSSLSEEVAFALAQGLKVIACVGVMRLLSCEKLGQPWMLAVMMTVSDGDMTKLTNIPASEAGPPLAEHGENPKDSQLPQFTHFRSKFSTTILVLNIRHSLSHTSWKRVNVFPSLTLL
ncbi:unnamed protein product [Brassica oleracea var. botrytis]|uniref:Uncharacterized protein n=2 Tax=Brassica TaxID=3705 RepID=A0A3P6ES60_BRAOL|nr:unnamed protein product [Brassica napus]VDD47837.1 unnamed protein product [Brassica oleracea]